MKSITLFILVLIGQSTFAQKLVASFKPVDSKYNWGYLNEKGDVIIEPSYKGAFDFCEEGFAPVYEVKSKTWSYVSIENKPLDIALKSYEPNNIMGYGRTGFENGVAILVVKKKKGVINLKGEVVHAPKYDFISKFNNDYATAKIGTEFFVLNVNGEKTKIDASMLAIKKFSNGLAAFKGRNELFGYVNSKGEVVVEPQFQGVGHFKGDLAWAKSTSKKVGFINQKGDWVIEAQYLAAKNMSDEGIARVKKESGWALVKKDGSEISVEGVVSYGDFREGLAFARQGKLFGFINSKGEWVVKPTYLKVKAFSNGLAAVRTNDKWGFINKKGDLVFKEQAKAIRNFKNGYAAVASMNNLWGVINTKGEWVVDPIYTKVKDFNLVK